MAKFILNYKRLTIYSLILGVIAGGQAVALKIKRGNSKVYVGNCTLVDWETTGPSDRLRPEMHLWCGDVAAATSDGEVVVSYLKNPGEVTCTVFADGSAECETRPPPERRKLKKK